jgi:EpsI family protein
MGSMQALGEASSTPRNLLLLVGLLVSVGIAYWPSTRALSLYWFDPDNSAQHGMLIVLLSSWLLFESRSAISAAPLRPARWAFPLLLVCGAGSLVFWRAGIQTLQLSCFPVLLWLTVCAALGARVGRLTLFPIAYLYFAVPGWGLLGPVLRRLTIWAAGTLTPLLGVPAHVEGASIRFAGGSFEVTSACSGVDFLVVALAVAALLGELERASLSRRTALLALMAVVAVFANWLRVVLIVAIGYSTGMRNVLATEDHLAFGWAVFATVLVAFVWLSARTAQRTAPRAQHGGQGGPEDRALWTDCVRAVAFMAAVPVVVYGSSIAMERTPGNPELHLPPGNGQWHGPEQGDKLWKPVFVGEHSEWQVTYQAPAGRRIDVLAIGYPRQAQGRELVNDENSLLGVHEVSSYTSGSPGGFAVAFREINAADDAGRRWLIWTVYDIGGRFFATPLYSQLWYGLRSLGETPYSMLLALRVQCDLTCDAARATLADFVRIMGPSLVAELRAADSAPIKAGVGIAGVASAPVPHAWRRT